MVGGFPLNRNPIRDIFEIGFNVSIHHFGNFSIGHTHPQGATGLQLGHHTLDIAIAGRHHPEPFPKP